MDRLIRVLARHKFAVAFSLVVLGLPILLALTPLTMMLIAVWVYVVLSEVGRSSKDDK